MYLPQLPNLKHLAVASVLLLCSLSTSSAQSDKQTAIENCLTLIRASQLPDGAFRMKSNGDPDWIRPYFGNFAAMALLAGKNPKDRDRVLAWLDWYAKAQLPDGSINDWEGGIASGYKDNGTRDSVDSYAATYLMAVDRYQRTTKKLPKRIAEAAAKALEALNSVYDDGLTWDKPDRKMKYIQDNIETYGGLAAAQRLFEALGDKEKSNDAKLRKEAVASKLQSFFRPDENLFAFVLRVDGKYQVHESDPKQRMGAVGMANLVGLTWISSKNNAPWEYVNKQFAADGGEAPQAPIERWYMASLHVSPPNEVAQWRKRTIAEAQKFNKDSVYLSRTAITALALLEGSDWMPQVKSGTD